MFELMSVTSLCFLKRGYISIIKILLHVEDYIPQLYIDIVGGNNGFDHLEDTIIRPVDCGALQSHARCLPVRSLARM